MNCAPCNDDGDLAKTKIPRHRWTVKFPQLKKGRIRKKKEMGFCCSWQTWGNLIRNSLRKKLELLTKRLKIQQFTLWTLCFCSKRQIGTSDQADILVRFLKVQSFFWYPLSLGILSQKYEKTLFCPVTKFHLIYFANIDIFRELIMTVFLVP